MGYVPLEKTRPIRARNAEEKKRRHYDILKAAERLWANTSYSELSMNEVAREAKLAKGTLYLYFKTKEELFLALLSEHLSGWMRHLTALLEERKPQKSQELADVLVESCQGQEPLRRLLLLLGVVLDQKVDVETARNFRRHLRRELRPVLERFPYDAATSMQILVHLYALGIGWQQVGEASKTDVEASALPEHYRRLSFDREFSLALHAVMSRIVAQADC